MKHPSTSTEQQSAETYLIAALEKEIRVPLKPAKLVLKSGSTVQVDGVNKNKKILCEIYARIDKLKGSQPDKVASDILKMILVEKSLGGSWEKHYCFASQEAASYLKGKSWLANVASELGIKIHIYELPEQVANSVIKAQNRQLMVNN